MFVLFYTNDFYFCFTVSWVRTAMTNSGERRKFNFLNLLLSPLSGIFIFQGSTWLRYS